MHEMHNNYMRSCKCKYTLNIYKNAFIIVWGCLHQNIIIALLGLFNTKYLIQKIIWQYTFPYVN